MTAIDPPFPPAAAEHILENRRLWDEMAPDWVAGGEANWRTATPTWGVWSVSNEVLPLLPAEHGLSINWIHADAEHLPVPSACADFAISEYGAALWCRPERWLTEAARILRPGGRLVFLTSHPLAAVRIPPNGAAVNTTLNRSYFGLDVLDWRGAEVDPGGIEFNRPISAWFRTLT